MSIFRNVKMSNSGLDTSYRIYSSYLVINHICYVQNRLDHQYRMILRKVRKNTFLGGCVT
ncbi:unnamed protein product [Meloidogyne enterolobii]|uniref:Uncharacterized protein n=1 Tax=Meloidogyne enterolobii TaxID=390850 RepID=A0ACB1A952_MELEN